MLLKILFVVTLIIGYITSFARDGFTLGSFLTAVFTTIGLSFLTFYPRKDLVFWGAFVIFGIVSYALLGLHVIGVLLLVLLVRKLYGVWFDRDDE